MKLGFLILLSLAGIATYSGDSDPTALPQPVRETPDFAMLDTKGRHFQLRRTDAKAVVLFFTANGCPIARKSVESLNQLERVFAPQKIVFWFVNSNPGDDRESIREEARNFGYGSIPVLVDDTQGVAAALKVRRTGTAVCIDPKSLKVLYHGAIDDRLTEGAEKPTATATYLKSALEEIVAGKNVTQPVTQAHGCLISIQEETSLSYSSHIAPILEDKCFTCHRPGNIGPFAMSSFKKVKGMADMVQEVLLTKRMPPWHADPAFGSFENNTSLTLPETRSILRWVEGGAPRGDGEDPLEMATPPTDAWKLGEPDLIVALLSPQEIPANGVLDYRHIKVPAPLENDVWIKGVVARAGNSRVVHHIIVRVREPGQKGDNPDDAFLIGWAPGGTEMFFPDGTGKLIKKGSILDFEMHYTTSGRPETDQSSIGLYFHQEKPEMVLKTHAAWQQQFEIRPGNPEEKTHGTHFFKGDSLLFDLSPHMHLRGSWMKYEALYPNGKREVLLSVPNYDFKWQHTYRLKEPKRMPAGTWILCTGAFDNSAQNPNNPDPTARITWGDQSFDEMFIGFMSVAEIPAGPKVTAR